MRQFLPMLLVFLPLMVGCSNKTPTLYPVSGKVLINGSPMEKVTIVFHRESENDFDRTQMKPTAETKEDGSFIMSTNFPGDGVAKGTYRVTFLKEQKGKGEEDRAGTTDALGGKYLLKEKSKIIVTIKEGPNALETFQLN